MRAYSPQARSSRPQYPYFKVQVFDGETMAWKDKRKRYRDELTAWAACGTGDRLMRVDREGRSPVYKLLRYRLGVGELYRPHRLRRLLRIPLAEHKYILVGLA